MTTVNNAKHARNISSDTWTRQKPIGLALDLYKTNPCIVPGCVIACTGLVILFGFSLHETTAVLFLCLLPDALKVVTSAAD